MTENPTEKKLNLYGVIFEYSPYNELWTAYSSSEQHRNMCSGMFNTLEYELLKSKSIKKLIKFITKYGYVRYDIKYKDALIK